MKTKSRNADISLGPLADDISQLVHATTELSADKVQEARERLSSAVANGKAACDRMSAKVVDGTKAADRYVRHNPYRAIAICAGIGLLLGLVLARRD